MTQTTESAAVSIAKDTMYGDLCNLVVDELKAAPDVWQKLPEDQQTDVICRVRDRVRAAIEQAVRAIAADGRETITADLESILAKDGIKAVLQLSKSDPKRHSLLDSVGRPVLVVIAGAEAFFGGDGPKAEATQLPLEGVDKPVADRCPATAEEA